MVVCVLLGFWRVLIMVLPICCGGPFSGVRFVAFLVEGTCWLFALLIGYGV